MKLCGETSRLRLGFHLSFEHFDVILMMETVVDLLLGTPSFSWDVK